MFNLQDDVDRAAVPLALGALATDIEDRVAYALLKQGGVDTKRPAALLIADPAARNHRVSDLDLNQRALRRGRAVNLRPTLEVILAHRLLGAQAARREQAAEHGPAQQHRQRQNR